MYYITKAGLEFLNETKARKPKATTYRQVITPKTIEALKDTLPPNPGHRSTAPEEQILALQTKMDNIKRVKARTGKELT